MPDIVLANGNFYTMNPDLHAGITKMPERKTILACTLTSHVKLARAKGARRHVSFLNLPQARVGVVPKPVPEKVEAIDGKENGKSGDKRDPRCG